MEGGESEEELPEGTERQAEDDPKADAISKILGSPKKIPVTTKCALELDKAKKPLIEVDMTLIRKLEPHQVEGSYLLEWVAVFFSPTKPKGVKKMGVNLTWF